MRFPLAPLLGWDVADPWMALGFVLAAIPLVLYFLERRRTKVVDWPAMRFFLTDLKRSIRWMHFKEFLVIAIRTIIIAGLVAALLRPGQSAPRAPSERAGGSRGAVILLDNSYGMAARAAEGVGPSAFDAARAAAIEVLARLAPGDLVQLATIAGRPAALTAEPIRSLADARALVRGTALAGGGAAVLSALDLAADLARAMPVPLCEVVLITNLKARGWSPGDEVRWRFVKTRLASLRPVPAVTVIDVGNDETSNRAVLDLELSRPVVGADQAVEIAAQAAQLGDTAPRSVEAVLKVDGEERESRAVQLAEGTPGRVRFGHRFGAPGPHRVDVLLRGVGDGLAEDDVRHLAVDVLDRVSVLIVSGSAPGARDSSLDGDGDLIDLALSPRAPGIAAPEALFRPTVIGAPELEQLRSADLAAYRVVVLADVPSLESSSARLIEDWVRSGGGLLIFAGEKVNATAYNHDLFRDGRGILPARLATLEEPAEAVEGLTIPGGIAGTHLALAAFGDPMRLDLEKVLVRRYWRTEPPPAGSTKLAELRGGVPYLLEKPAGRGRVILASSGARLRDGDLPRRPLFVPLVHGLATYLAASADDRRNLLLGESLVLRVEGAQAGAQASVTDPSGVTQEVAIERLSEEGAGMGAQSAVRYGPLNLPGFYTVKVGAGAAERSSVFAANLDPEESNLKRITAEELARVEKLLGFQLVRNVADLRLYAGDLERREWWRPILWAVVGLLLLEVLVTRALARGRAPWRGAAREGEVSETT
jgi:aerotolerance regulator-like protein